MRFQNKRRSIQVFVLFISSLNIVFAQKKEVNEEKVAKLELSRIQVIPITETKNDRQYELYIKLPEGYSENTDTRHPVLYYTDAIWHVEILSGSAEFLMENAILVGISWQKDIDVALINAQGKHVSRYRDYSVRESTNPELQAKYQLGQAANHIDFIRNEVIPYVENNYRTDPGNRGYFGYSLGGLFGAYVLLAQPDTFSHYILGSPSLQGDLRVLAELESGVDGLNANVFISYGDLEDKLKPLIEEFVAMLKNKNDESLSIQQEVISGSHQTAFPLTSVRGVTWLSELINE